MALQQVSFVDGISHNKIKRDHELIVSEIRSHAAKVTHAKKQKAKRERNLVKFNHPDLAPCPHVLPPNESSEYIEFVAAEGPDPKQSYSSSLLWVNHTADNMTTLRHRQRVFKHIQQKYRPWQRRDTAVQLRKNAKVPKKGSKTSAQSQTSDAQSVHSHHSSSSDIKSSDSRSLVSEPLSCDSPQTLVRTSQSGIRSQPSSLSRQPDASWNRRNSEYESIQYLLGNSDPFDAYPLKIGPKVNDVLKFYRDFAIPSQYHTGPDGWITTKPANDDWKIVIKTLHERGSALGFVARWSQVASHLTKNHDLTLQGLRFRADSTAILRKKLIEAGGNEVPRSVFWHMVNLYLAEVQAGNGQGAWFHAAMIHQELRRQLKRGQVDLITVRTLIYNEASACCMFLRQPVLDYETLIPAIFESTWAEARKELAGVDLAIPSYLDDSIDNDFLRDMFLRQRHNLAVWQMGFERAEGLSPLVFVLWCSSHLVNHTRTLKYALDSIDASERCATNSTWGLLHKNAYLTLTVVYWTRLIAGDEAIFEMEIHQTKRPLLNRLRQLMQEDSAHITRNGVTKYPNPRLWALYVGARAEAALGLENDTDTKENGRWFREEFSLHAARMKLTSWGAISKIFQGFLTLSVEQWDGEEFVTDLISAPVKKSSG